VRGYVEGLLLALAKRWNNEPNCIVEGERGVVFVWSDPGVAGAL
jgi:hypothetical protein